MHKAWLTSSLGTISAVLLSAGLIVAGPAFAADSSHIVRASGEAGWVFNRDVNTSTPYDMTTAEWSTGNGSLYVLPIVNDSNGGGHQGRLDKFIAELPGGMSTNDFELSYDFLVAAAGAAGATAYKQFYLNVYTNLPGSTTFYDCRFDYVPGGGALGAWSSATFGASDVSTARSPLTCPASPAGMPDGSTVRGFALNVGDTSLNDTGLAGYLDNVVVTTTDGAATYDFEADPTSKDDCKKGGFAAFSFKNQGECIAWWNSPKG